MRKISAAIVAAMFAILSLGASAATVGTPAQGVKAQSTFELIKKKAKTYKKAVKAKKAKKVSKKGGKKVGGKAGRCGTGKYFKKGKCVSASDKK